MLSMIGEAQSKVEKCENISNNLQHSLTELENQRDDAQSLIKETFQVRVQRQLHVGTDWWVVLPDEIEACDHYLVGLNMG